MYALLADLVLVAHLAFVVFVVAGGLLAVRWAWVAWIHLPCAAWGATVELAGWICPLTPLEVEWRRRAGEEGFSGGFLDHYVMPILYPEGLTREVQIALGAIVIVLNLAVYAWVWRRHRGAGTGGSSSAEGA